MTFSVKMKIDYRGFERLLEKNEKNLRAAFVRALDRGAEIVEKAAKLNLTSNKSVVFGVLRASIGHETDKALLRTRIGPGLAARPSGTGDPRSYGLFVEEGRKAGKAPPAQDLQLWVKRKLGIGEPEEVERVAFLIARKIGRSGTTPAPYLVPAIKKNEGRINARMQVEIDREVDRINSAGGRA